MRDNPYGQRTAPNPDNIPRAMNRNDPRQRGLLGAAWTLVYFTHFARGGVRQIAVGGTVGPFGLMHAPADFAQPWFDEHGRPYPVYHVASGLAGLRGATMRAADVSAPREIQAFAAGDEVWIANLVGEPRRVSLQGLAATMLARLDAETFVAASRGSDALDCLERPFAGGELELDSYACARLRVI
jgi:hypothetical protein